MAETADKYDLPGWMELLCSKLKTEEELSAEKVAEMIIAGSRHQHSAARELREVAKDKIKERREILQDTGFRDRLRGLDVLFEFLEDVMFPKIKFFLTFSAFSF